ncbi:MAG: ABC transporter permease [Chloroflexi bacterium]|nr:ABC transporter permease [Chloroflexota bacterium]
MANALEPDHEVDPALLEASAELGSDLEAMAPPTQRLAADRRRPRWKAALGILAILVAILVVWEGLKLLGGNRLVLDRPLGLPIQIDHRPPFTWKIANDLSLPHLWTVAAAFFEMDSVGDPLALRLLWSALATFRGALVGFALGAGIGLALAALLIQVRFLERSLVPLLVASQTVPIVAIAPIIVVGLKAGWFGIAIVAAYLTFFPVTVAAIRGMRSADPRAFELLRSYAATDRQVLTRLRLPAAAPFLFTAFRIAATASVVGAIVGELPSGTREGLGGAILNAMQYYSIQPGRLWATIIVASLLGIGCFLLVVLAERRALRNYRPATEPGAAA